VIITVIAGRWFNGILNSAWRFQCLLRAQRCDDRTVTFQRAWPPGKYAPPPLVVSAGCSRPSRSPKIGAWAD
jgi:hypothetical protein